MEISMDGVVSFIGGDPWRSRQGGKSAGNVVGWECLCGPISSIVKCQAKGVRRVKRSTFP